MWNKRKDEDVRQPAAPAAPLPADITREPAPVAAPPAARPASTETVRGVAAIGKSVIIKGQILAREDLYLDGEMEGTVEVPEHRLTIGPHAKLQASIRAREVVVLGSVNGNVEAIEKMDIRKDARLIGDIKTGGIVIEDGAFFKGSIDIVRPEPAKQARQQQSQPQAQAVPVAAAPAVAGDKR
ncbi:MAG TPA: polymer-forming cytoskeletal protein [Bryobacteraceae bacterium]|nr:polymer-forming cytoskeletal protein [Bryobacteraceae bacterium]